MQIVIREQTKWYLTLDEWIASSLFLKLGEIIDWLVKFARAGDNLTTIDGSLAYCSG